jgi:hypothetical protein
MIYYMKEDSRFIDFNTLREKTKRSRTFLNQFLNKVEVRKIHYRNRLLFNFDDVIQNKEISKYF